MCCGCGLATRPRVEDMLNDEAPILKSVLKLPTGCLWLFDCQRVGGQRSVAGTGNVAFGVISSGILYILLPTPNQ